MRRRSIVIEEPLSSFWKPVIIANLNHAKRVLEPEIAGCPIRHIEEIRMI